MPRKHPVTQRIEEAIALIERVGGEITPTAVRANVEPKLTWQDWSPEEASGEALEVRIARYLRSNGYVIADAAPREGGRVRKDYWDALVSELEEQIEVKEKSNTYDRNRIKAEKAVITFLRSKEAELGYEPYPGLFHAEIDRIYSMHSVTAPA